MPRLRPKSNKRDFIVVRRQNRPTIFSPHASISRLFDFIATSRQMRTRPNALEIFLENVQYKILNQIKYQKVIECLQRIRDKHPLMDVISLNQQRTFSIAEANKLLPVIYRITEESHQKVKKFLNQLEALKSVSSVKVVDMEHEISHEVERWQDKMKKLGVNPKGLWLADFDTGKGYLCWKFPETEVKFFHGYQDGFSGRLEVDSVKNLVE